MLTSSRSPVDATNAALFAASSSTSRFDRFLWFFISTAFSSAAFADMPRHRNRLRLAASFQTRIYRSSLRASFFKYFADSLDMLA
jgi:hypothetical protein